MARKLNYWKVMSPVAKVNELPTGPETIYKTRERESSKLYKLSQPYVLPKGGWEGTTFISC